MTDEAEILEEFLVEAREIIDKLDLDFVQLEKSPADGNLLGDVFRGVHTLKGSSGFFSFKRLELVSHAGESLLSKLREKSLELTTDMVTILLRTLDTLRDIVDDIEANRAESAGDDTLLLANLQSLTVGGGLISELEEDNPVATGALPAVDGVDGVDGVTTPSPDVAVEPMGVAVIESDSEGPSDEVAPEALDVNAQVNAASPPVKVSVELLDSLMNLVSEMVLARNRLITYAAQATDPQLTGVVRNVDFITLELQERMMKTRMSPISQVWDKFPRLVRDLAQACGKEVDLHQRGAETELDRTLLEMIKAPLIHLIRNSVDHGIEDAQTRLQSGKPATGSVTLHAKHENGMVVVEVLDDGDGIDLNAVRAKVIELGLADAKRAAKLDADELIEFIYLPGFSTNDAVTNVSGRGVGMDVVRTNLQNIGGSVEVTSSPLGTCFKLKIPLTLAIMPTLFVRCAAERFAIPQSNLLEMVRYHPGDNTERLEYLYGVPVFRLREKLVPLIFLAQSLELRSANDWGGETLNIAVVQSSGVRFGLVVDEVLDMQEVVVKPMVAILRSRSIYSGATILGDGRVALILDIEGVAKNACISGKIREYQRKEAVSGHGAADAEHALLLFELSGDDRLAIPVNQVERLERIERADIQKSGSESVIPYGDEIMKLVWLADYVDGSRHVKKNAALSIIVHYADGLPIGLVVNQINDIVYVPGQLNITPSHQKGHLGCAVIDEQVINVIDVDGILLAHNSRFLSDVPRLSQTVTVEEPL